MNPHIRWMIRRDLPRVLEIENDCFPDPWTEDNFVACLRQRNIIGMVADDRDETVGFMLHELHRNRLHVINFAVCPKRRREGVGDAMIRKLTGKLGDIRNRITLHVCERNLNGQLFFRACGFRAVSVVREMYDDGQDAYLFRYSHWTGDESQAVANGCTSLGRMS